MSFARRYPDHFRLMFRWKEIDRNNETLLAASARTYAEMTSSVTMQRGATDVTAETLYERMSEPHLQDDVLIPAWSQIHGYAMLLLEGQFDGFAKDEGEDAFRRADGAGNRCPPEQDAAQLTHGDRRDRLPAQAASRFFWPCSAMREGALA